MVKFAKNGSDVTDRCPQAGEGVHQAVIGRHLWRSSVLLADDWFIGTTDVAPEFPSDYPNMTLKFHTMIMKLCKFSKQSRSDRMLLFWNRNWVPPRPGYLQESKQGVRSAGRVLILDEMITGFRWDLGGAQKFHEWFLICRRSARPWATDLLSLRLPASTKS